MSESTKTTTKATTAAPAAAVDEHPEGVPGYIGIAVDPTPNEAYTLAGQAAGMPTPETDAEAKAKAEAHAKAVEQTVTGAGTP